MSIRNRAAFLLLGLLLLGGTARADGIQNPGASSTLSLGSGVSTALSVNVGTAGAFVVNGGALGTPSSGTLTNATGLPLTGLVNAAANTMVGNWTGAPAAQVANAMPACPNTGAKQLNYVAGTGVTCGTSKSGTITVVRDMTAATAAGVTYSGLGFAPTSCWGFGNVAASASQNVTVNAHSDAALVQHNLFISTTFQINIGVFLTFFDSSGLNGQNFTITSYTTDGFIGTWTKVATPSAGNATSYVRCLG
jgi:hypothetical protein